MHLDHTFCAKQRQDQSEHCSYQLRMDKESETQKNHPLLSATGDDDDNDDDGNSDEDDDDDDDFKEKLHASIFSRVCPVSKLFEIIKRMMVRMMIVMINMKFLGYWQKLVMFFGGS